MSKNIKNITSNMNIKIFKTRFFTRYIKCNESKNKNMYKFKLNYSKSLTKKTFISLYFLDAIKSIART